VAIALAVGIALWLLRRERNAKKAPPLDPNLEKHGHNRNLSNQTALSGQTLTYTNSTSLPGPATPGFTPTIRTHETSLHTFSVFGQPQPHANTVYTQTPSPPPQNPEDYVTPFTLQHSHTASGPSADRKSPSGLPSMPVYDSPNAPPQLTEDILFQTGERPRVNPPAYSAHPTGPVASGSSSSTNIRARPTHTTNSSDADLSYASFSPAGMQPSPLENANSDVFTTVTGNDNSVTRSGSIAQTTYTAATPASRYPRDVKRRPTTDESG